ncbi:Uncharacterized protein HZ326_23521 [Fusarium oxysporum f. sp. albedinis]|nr:Uncharacterized protein HZ326_23521 [Fusarium oxysporum f. sp. albedinis]
MLLIVKKRLSTNALVGSTKPISTLTNLTLRLTFVVITITILSTSHSTSSVTQGNIPTAGGGASNARPVLVAAKTLSRYKDTSDHFLQRPSTTIVTIRSSRTCQSYPPLTRSWLICAN